MQLTFGEILGLLGTFGSIIIGVSVIIGRFTKLEGRVGRLEEKVGKLEQKLDEVLFYLAPKIRRRKMKHLHRNEKGSH